MDRWHTIALKSLLRERRRHWKKQKDQKEGKCKPLGQINIQVFQQQRWFLFSFQLHPFCENVFLKSSLLLLRLVQTSLKRHADFSNGGASKMKKRKLRNTSRDCDDLLLPEEEDSFKRSIAKQSELQISSDSDGFLEDDLRRPTKPSYTRGSKWLWMLKCNISAPFQTKMADANYEITEWHLQEANHDWK